MSDGEQQFRVVRNRNMSEPTRLGLGQISVDVSYCAGRRLGRLSSSHRGLLQQEQLGFGVSARAFMLFYWATSQCMSP